MLLIYTPKIIHFGKESNQLLLRALGFCSKDFWPIYVPIYTQIPWDQTVILRGVGL